MNVNETIQKNVDPFLAVRSMFYFLKPSEAFFAETKDVPNLIIEVIPFFFAFMLIEQIVYLLKNGKFNGSLGDTVTSIGAGTLSLIPDSMFRAFHMSAYYYCYNNLRIYELPWNSAWTYFVAFVFVDFCFYWFHRATHEVNFFWASHQMHHSSEEFNLTTALRQSIVQKYIAWIFYLPMAFFIRPSIFIVHTHLNTLYQFWIHTELVDSLGPLEYILNTASHHRVHHGRNPYCIDKNYGGVLIIFDRIFGTFGAERKGEQIAYGLVHPIQSFDPTYVQFVNYKYLWSRFWQVKSLSEKFSVLFKGPGWMPGTPRLGNPQDIPPIQYPVKKYNKKISPFLNIYIGVCFIMMSLILSEFIKQIKVYPIIGLSLVIILILYSLTCFGAFFDDKKYAVCMEFIRCSIIFTISIKNEDYLKKLLFSSETLTNLFKFFHLITMAIMFFLSIRVLTQSNKKIYESINKNE